MRDNPGSLLLDRAFTASRSSPPRSLRSGVLCLPWVLSPGASPALWWPRGLSLEDFSGMALGHPVCTILYISCTCRMRRINDACGESPRPLRVRRINDACGNSSRPCRVRRINDACGDSPRPCACGGLMTHAGTGPGPGGPGMGRLWAGYSFLGGWGGASPGLPTRALPQSACPGTPRGVRGGFGPCLHEFPSELVPTNLSGSPLDGFRRVWSSARLPRNCGWTGNELPGPLLGTFASQPGCPGTF